MKYKIAVIGSSRSSELTSRIKGIAYEIGKTIVLNNCILLTGGGRGVSEEAARGVYDLGGTSIGISPARNATEHKSIFKGQKEVFGTLVFTGFGFKGRNVVLMRSCDAVIAINGGIGTLNELTIALDEGKQIGIIQGTAGIADFFVDYFHKIKRVRDFNGGVIYGKHPLKIFRELIIRLKKVRRR